MAFQETPVTDAASVISAIISFAGTTLGWAVAGSVITPPGRTGYELSSGVTSGRTYIDAFDPADPVRLTRVEFAQVWGGASFSEPAPTRVFLFGDAVEEPYLGVVIEFGTNQFRHLYLGHAVRAGDYTDGWLISSNYWPTEGDWIGLPRSPAVRYLFQGYGIVANAALAANKPQRRGGLVVNHVDNPQTWRRFYFQINDFAQGDAQDGLDNVTFDAVMGAAQDGFVGALEKRALANYAGANLLYTHPLIVSMGTNVGNLEWYPVGHPAGVRGVHLEGLEPLQEILIGGVTWKVFPELAKGNNVTSYPDLRNSGVNVTEPINSGFAGLAYSKDRV